MSIDSTPTIELSELVKDIIINDEEWRCSVTILQDTSVSQLRYEKLMNNACKEGYRNAIRVISKEETLATAVAKSRKVNVSYAVSPTPSLEQLRRSAREELMQTKQRKMSGNRRSMSWQITTSQSEAGIIKWMLYETRLDSLARRAAELRIAEERQSELLAMQLKNPVDIAKTVALPNTARRANSKLRKRGEEWKDRVSVDDAPENGPDLYIVLTGFRNPELPKQLINLDVPLHCILLLENIPLEADEDNECECHCDCQLSIRNTLSSTKTKNYNPDLWRNFDGRDLVVRLYNPKWRLDSHPYDVYDSISYALYDVYETIQAHVAYLRAMRITSVYEQRPKNQSTSRYEGLVRYVPDECASVPMLLEALLQQVEANCEETHSEESKDAGESRPSLRSKTTPEDKGDEKSVIASSLSKVNVAATFSRLNDKLHLLNLEYDLIPGADDASRQYHCPPAEPVLILHGDTLRLNACRANDEERGLNKEEMEKELLSASILKKRRRSKLFKEMMRAEVEKPQWEYGELASFSEGLLTEAPVIMEARSRENVIERENCAQHMDNIYKCCDKQGIHTTRAKHLLNLLGFRKFLESRVPNYNCPKDTLSFGSPKALAELRRQVLTPLESSRHASQISRPSTCSLGTSARFADGGRMLRSFEGCASLFGLMDAREFLLGLPVRCRGGGGDDDDNGDECLALEEFEEAELLGRAAFLQIVHDCFRESEEVGTAEFDAEYFPPTDSILLLYHDEPRRSGEVVERSVTCALRTPVCLRDFCDYVMDEEIEWLERRRRETISASDIARRCRSHMMGGGEDVDSGLIFCDEDFLLPGSLKALDLEEARRREAEEACSETTVEPQDGILSPSCRDLVAAKTKRQEIYLETRQGLRPVKAVDIYEKTRATGVKIQQKSEHTTGEPTAILASLEDLVRSAPVICEFDGYDVGTGRRVEVSCDERAYEASDGTRLRVTRDTWLLGEDDRKRVTTNVALTYLPGEPGDDDGGWCLRYNEAEGSGIFHVVTANGIVVAFARLPKSPEEVQLNKLLFEIQISWPSGLIIKPTEYQSAEYPFYVLQYYLSRDQPGCKNIDNEAYRKYLSNGDVIKFFDDGIIIVLRPTGTIITIENYGSDDQGSLTVHRGSDSSIDGATRPSADVYSRSQTTRSSASHSLKSRTSMSGSLASGSPMSSTLATLPGYSVLEADGRHYEVLEGFIVHELKDTQAILAQDYDPDEKFLRRADGMDMLFKANSELCITYPDGTRILSGCTVEDEPAHCDWTPEELEFYFGYDAEGKEVESGQWNEPEGFVSILAYGRAEHPNYATVVRRETAEGSICGLLMGKELCMELDPRGLGQLMLQPDDRVRIELNTDTVSVTRRNCRRDCCFAPSSHATFYLIEPDVAGSESPNEPDESLLTFCDADCELTVNREHAQVLMSRMAANPDGAERICACHGVKRHRPRRRLFVMEKDGKAYEYHRRGMRRRLEARMSEDENASLICRSVDAGLEYRLALQSMKSILGGSRVWLAGHKIPLARPTRQRRIGTEEENDPVWDEPLKAVNRPGPRFLMARVLEGISRPGENSLVAMQRALMEYWRNIAMGLADVCDCVEEEDETVVLMKDIISGTVTKIDWDMYEEGRKYMSKVKTRLDEERTRQLINCCYQRSSMTQDECPWWDNE